MDCQFANLVAVENCTQELLMIVAFTNTLKSHLMLLMLMLRVVCSKERGREKVGGGGSGWWEIILIILFCVVFSGLLIHKNKFVLPV